MSAKSVRKTPSSAAMLIKLRGDLDHPIRRATNKQREQPLFRVR